MKMMFIILCILITTVCGKNSTNAKFNVMPEEKLLDAVCHSFQKANATSCDTDCEWEQGGYDITEFRIAKNESALYLPKLRCKEGGSVNIHWDNYDDYAYFLQIAEVNSDVRFFSNATTCNNLTVYDLKENANYTIQLWAVSISKKEILYSDETTIETTAEDIIPSPVTDLEVYNITYNNNTGSAVVIWSPNEDRSCLYDFVWYSDDELTQDTVNIISGSYQTVLRNLAFDTKYTLHIRARVYATEYESPKKSVSFHTVTCAQAYKSLQLCRPDEPTGFDVHEIPRDPLKGTFDVHLTWQKPDILPDYYTAHFANLVDNNTVIKNRTDIFQNITGDKTEYVFENVKLTDFYHVGLRACSSAGCSSQAMDKRFRTALPPVVVDTFASQQWKVLVIVLVPLFTLLSAVIGVNYYCVKKRKLDSKKYFMELPAVKNTSTDGWELDPNSLHYESVIGEGAFGVVRKAHLEMKNNTKIEVAVKMLKESPSSEDIRQFTQEIEIMKSVGQHPFIVSLIGCITEGRTDGSLLVVEYCPRGDLQTYLRNAWMTLCERQQEIDNTKEIQCFANQTYDFDNMNLESDFIINPKHLLSIARQVAMGMEHLAKTRVVHRDLAARNVLICENLTVKVSDFGLSRDIYQNNVYCKSSRGKVPVRWMALESLTHQRYTTQSDVWSFGILLWEIVTLGETPYGGIHSSDLLQFLKSGNRMGRPANCSEELYSIMQSCWKASSKNRPTFTEICKSLEDLL